MPSSYIYVFIFFPNPPFAHRAWHPYCLIFFLRVHLHLSLLLQRHQQIQRKAASSPSYTRSIFFPSTSQMAMINTYGLLCLIHLLFSSFPFLFGFPKLFHLRTSSHHHRLLLICSPPLDHLHHLILAYFSSSYFSFSSFSFIHLDLLVLHLRA